MTEQPLVSVIINCYNSEEFLRETIDSVLAQTYHNWEIILWDNQSTDATSEIAKSYNDERIRYFYAPTHTPLGEARNYAMDKAKGDYLTFLDSDDVWLPEFLERGIEILETDKALVGYYSNRYVIRNSTKIVGNDELDGIRSIEDIITNYRIDVSACTLRFCVIRDNHVRVNNSYQMIEDFDFFINVASHGNYYYDNRPLMCCRVHMSETYKKRDRWYFEYCSFRESADKLHNKGVISNNCLKAIDDKIIESKLGYLVCENCRIDYVIHILRHFCQLHKCWKQMLLFVILGRDRFLKVMNNRLLS